MQTAKKPIVAIARLQGQFDSLAALDDALWSTIASRSQTQYRIVRLDPVEGPCDSTCAIASAKWQGAKLVVLSRMIRSLNGYYINTTIVLVEDGRTVRELGSSFLSDASQLLSGTRQVASDTANVLFPPTVDGSWGSMSQERTNLKYEDYRERNMDSPDYKAFESKRNMGVTLFLIGIVCDSVGGGLLGAGIAGGTTGLIVSGGIVEAFGVVLFFGGLGQWIANQIRMNKIERGIPLSHRLRLDGLSPLVASRDGAAPGLNAAFSF